MPHIPVISESDATGKLQEIYADCQRRAGYIANILRLQSLTPTVLAESLRFYIALMKSPNALSAADREMLATVVSNANDCFY